ncbi:hypothetical protein [Thalassotalea crassostreae]|uniref:hypothetical protein n=1 Tax=Thalassotalea crassostreae TaxID=1763536 RepID=UPI0008394CE0|nr:hypothetical protein [Thalassotalea crassostreae]
MQLIKSLFCIKGHDIAERFLAIAIGSLMAFSFFNEAILSSVIARSLWAVIFVSLYFCSALRRCRDSGNRSSIAFIATILFALALTAIIAVESSSSYITLLPALLMSLVVFSLPSTTARVYVMGYSGPVDLSGFSQPEVAPRKPMSNRIEPSLFGQSDAADEQQATYQQSLQAETVQTVEIAPRLVQNDFANLLNKFLTGNKTLAMASGAILVIISVVVIGLPFFSNNLDETAEDEELNQVEEKQVVEVKERGNMLAMPDDFYLLLDQHQALIIHFKADLINNGVIWSQATAQGDDTCEVIEFNRGDKIRTINVEVEADGSYYVNFSPLDTEELVTLIAKRGNFGVCGYNFSLKGSTKALNSNSIYADLVN